MAHLLLRIILLYMMTSKIQKVTQERGSTKGKP